MRKCSEVSNRPLSDGCRPHAVRLFMGCNAAIVRDRKHARKWRWRSGGRVYSWCKHGPATEHGRLG